MSCHFCPRPAELFTQPPLCERHIELVMLRANMQRSGIAFTPEHAARELLRLCQGGATVVTRPSELPELINQMCREDYAPA